MSLMEMLRSAKKLPRPSLHLCFAFGNMIELNHMSSCHYFGGFRGKALGLLRDAYEGNNGVIIYNGIQS